MKNHIAFKFIAIVLCAAALLGAIGSGLSIALLTGLNLYDKNVDQIYTEQRNQMCDSFARDVAEKYAGSVLGGCPESMLYGEYGWRRPFDTQYVRYQIVDGEGTLRTMPFPLLDTYSTTVLEGPAPAGAATYRIPVTGKYMYLLSATPDQVTEPTEAPIPCEVLIMDVDMIRMTEAGEQCGLDLSVYPEDTTDPLTFRSLDESVATVDKSGVITAVAPGSTVIIVTCGSQQLERPVYFEAPQEATMATSVEAEAVPAVISAEAGEGEQTDEGIDAYSEDASSEDADAYADEESDEDAEAPVQEESNENADADSGEESAQPPAEEPTAVPTVVATEALETIPAETMTDGLPESIPETLMVAGKPVTDYQIYTTRYWDENLQCSVNAEYVLLDLPPITVVIHLLPGAIMEEAYRPVLENLYNIRHQLFPALLLFSLAFAVILVYLCCAAGRKPKSDTVRAGGVNRLPLELYLGALAVAATGLIVAAADIGQELMLHNAQICIRIFLTAGYLVCLMAVGFLFALAAQLKTPGRFWLRNSLAGHCLRLAVYLWHLLLKSIAWLALALEKKVFPWVGRLLKAIWKRIKSLFAKIVAATEQFFRLLPLTWQWLLTGAILLSLLLIGFALRSVFVVFLAILLCLAVTLYGSHCFGVLLKNTNRMSKGDLDAQINDKRLLGCFLDFGQALNALAGVAVVAAQKQLKSERMKTELITNVSHDIKTPLTSIISYADLLQKPHTPEEEAQYLEVLSRQSMQLKKLIEDLIEMSKASTGNMVVDITQVDAVEAMNQALGEFSDKLDKANLTPVFRHSEDAAPMMADGKLLWRVLHNLLSNAVKYAMPGTRLYVDLLCLEGKVILSMKNISREELNVDAEELMERFVRGDDSRNTEGSGLGLNIAKSMMELQKGSLQLLVDGDLFKVTLIFPGA